MLDKIIAFSLKNRLFIVLGAIAVLIWGYYAVRQTEVDVFPDLNAPTVVVMTEAPGMAAEEVEQLVTFPIETAVNGAVGVRRVRSSSTSGFSAVQVEFDWDTDVYIDRQIVAEKIAEVADRLPKGANTPVLGPQSSILGEMMIVSLTSDSVSLMDLRSIADWTVRPRLLSAGGVAQVSVIGGDLKEYQIQLDPLRMSHYGISLNNVLEVVRDANRNTNGGIIYEYGNEYQVRGMQSPDVIDRMSKSVLSTNNGNPVLLGDVAEIVIGAESPKLGVASERGKPAVLLTVTKQPKVSTIDLTERIDNTIAELKKSLPKDINISTNIFRQSDFIESSIGNVKDSLWEGAVFVVIVLFLFLANIRTTVISLITIPLSLMVTLLVLHLSGNTINTMSLGGMAIAIGSLVDDAIVDVENVWKRLRINRRREEKARLHTLKVIYDASREVRTPILNSTLIIIVSFVPLFFLSGMEGRMLIPLGIAFIVALIASTVVALTLTPVLCSYLLTDKAIASKLDREPWVSRKLKEGYARVLDYVLVHQKGVIAFTIVALLGTIGIFLTLGNSFLPPFNEGSFTINISSMPGISLEESDRIGKQAEEILLTIPEIKTVARKTGRAELDEHALGVNVSEIEAPFELKGRSHHELEQEVRHKLAVIKGANIEIGKPISHRIDAMLSGTQANIAIKLYGDNLQTMYRLGNKIKEEIQSVKGIADLNVEQQVERPEIRIIPKPEILAMYGINQPAFNEFIEVMLGGEVVSQVYEGNRNYNLTVKAGDASMRTKDEIEKMLIDTGDGKKVPLAEVADIKSVPGPNTINRENVKRKLVISANTSGRDLSGVVNDIKEVIDTRIVLPEGYHIEYGGQFEARRKAGNTLLWTSLISILVIYLLLYMEFGSFKESAVILLNLPFALIGGVLMIRFTTGVISIPSIIGFISLFGIATRNGMLLISRYNTLRKDNGLKLHEAVVTGSLDRLNPIVMTAMTSALALIPLAVRGDLPGNEIQSPMAMVILGGLVTSTILNALIIPIMYLRLHRNNIDNANNQADNNNQADK